MVDHCCCQEFVRLFADSDSWYIGSLFENGLLTLFTFFYADDEEEHLDYVQLTQKHKVAIRAIRRVNYQESHVHNKILNHRLKACNLKQHRIHTKYILLNGRFSLHFGEPNLRNILIYNCRWSFWLLDENSKKPWSLTTSKMSSNNTQPATLISSVVSRFCKQGSRVLYSHSDDYHFIEIVSIAQIFEYSLHSIKQMV